MTTISDGSGGADAGGDAGGAGGGGAGGDAGGAGDKPYYESFADAQLRASPSVQNFKTVEELAKGFVNLEKRFGIDPNRRIDLPADPADKEGMRAVYTKLGLPEKPEGYGMQLAADASDADKDMLSKFTARAHEMGLPVDLARGVMEFWMDQVKATQEATTAAETARMAEGKAALEKEFGAAYETRTREIEGLLKKYGDPELVASLTGDKLNYYPNVAKLLGKLLDRMAEPGTVGGQAGDAGGDMRALTPSQAQAAVARLESDPVKGAALRDRSHAQHKAVLAEREALLKMTQPAA